MADLIETLGIAPIVFPLDYRLLPEKPGAVLIDLGGEPALRELAVILLNFRHRRVSCGIAVFKKLKRFCVGTAHTSTAPPRSAKTSAKYAVT